MCMEMQYIKWIIHFLILDNRLVKKKTKRNFLVNTKNKAPSTQIESFFLVIGQGLNWCKCYQVKFTPKICFYILIYEFNAFFIHNNWREEQFTG